MERNQSGLSAESACVCLRAVQIEKPFMCTIHLSCSIVFSPFPLVHSSFFCTFIPLLQIIWMIFLLHSPFYAYLLSFIPNIHEKKTDSIAMILSVFSYPFQMFAALQMEASVAIVHLSVENYSLVHPHGQAPEKRTAMKTFCPTSPLCFVQHPVDDFRYFASLNVPKRP